MKPRIELSVSEMLQLRKDGYNNKDIAKILDIALPTVYRYIGGQGCRMESALGSGKRKSLPHSPATTLEKRDSVATKSKYHSKKITVDGETFDSKKEYFRWRELQLLERRAKLKT